MYWVKAYCSPFLHPNCCHNLRKFQNPLEGPHSPLEFFNSSPNSSSLYCSYPLQGHILVRTASITPNIVDPSVSLTDYHLCSASISVLFPLCCSIPLAIPKPLKFIKSRIVSSSPLYHQCLPRHSLEDTQSRYAE